MHYLRDRMNDVTCTTWSRSGGNTLCAFRIILHVAYFGIKLQCNLIFKTCCSCVPYFRLEKNVTYFHTIFPLNTYWFRYHSKINCTVTASISKQLTQVPRVQEVVSSSHKDRPNLIQCCKRFATTSTSAQVAVFPWRYDVEVRTVNSLYTLAQYGTYNERFGFGLVYYQRNVLMHFLNHIVSTVPLAKNLSIPYCQHTIHTASSDAEAAAFPIASDPCASTSKIILHNFMSKRRNTKVKHAGYIISSIFQIS